MMAAAPPLTADVAEMLSIPLRILDCKVSLLEAAWKQLDHVTEKGCAGLTYIRPLL